MTIKKGQAWGTPTSRPDGLIVARSDARLAALLVDDPDRHVSVSDGDVHRTLGSPPDREQMQRLPLDALAVTVDGVAMTAVAHVVARRGWWRGRIVAVMNVDHIGDWNVAPRAHPNDGRMDVVDVDEAMTPRQRWAARRRLAAGLHIPHPNISVRTATTADWNFERPYDIWLDGVRVATSTSLSVEVRPDAFFVTV